MQSGIILNILSHFDSRGHNTGYRVQSDTVAYRTRNTFFLNRLRHGAVHYVCVTQNFYTLPYSVRS